MAEQKLTFEQAKEKVKGEYGECVSTTAGGGVVCHPAKGGDFHRFTDAVTRATAGKGSLYDAARTLVLSCLVYPSADSAVVVFDKYPGLVNKLCEGIQAKSGAEAELEGN